MIKFNMEALTAVLEGLKETNFVIDVEMSELQKRKLGYKDAVICKVIEKEEGSILVDAISHDMPESYPHRFYDCDVVLKYIPLKDLKNITSLQ